MIIFIYFNINFNPRSREGSDITLLSIFYDCTDFNPRSREGSDIMLIQYKQKRKISIHAPARGATSINRDVYLFHKISIHAPARGATKSIFCLMH